jgi:hypothetical protein
MAGDEAGAALPSGAKAFDCGALKSGAVFRHT